MQYPNQLPSKGVYRLKSTQYLSNLSKKTANVSKLKGAQVNQNQMITFVPQNVGIKAAFGSTLSS